MTEKNIYSIKDFAKKIGVSQQAIYKKLDTTLKEFVVVKDGKKYISGDYFTEQTNSTYNSTNSTFETENNSTVETADYTDIFTARLEEKDKFISTLQLEIVELKNTIVEKDKLLSDYAIRFADLALQSQQIASQAQELAGQSNALRALEEPKERRGLFARIFKK